MTDFNSRRHNLAIRQEIGERLQLLLSRDAEDIPPRLRQLVDRLDGEEHGGREASSSISNKSIIDRLYRRWR